MKDLSIQEFETLLCSTGYLPPRSEEELLFFNQLYEGYESSIADRHVDVESIINGTFCLISGSNSCYEIPNDNTLMAAEEDGIYSMAARNYGKLPKDIIDKMKDQHKPKDNNEK